MAKKKAAKKKRSPAAATKAKLAAMSAAERLDAVMAGRPHLTGQELAESVGYSDGYLRRLRGDLGRPGEAAGRGRPPVVYGRGDVRRLLARLHYSEAGNPDMLARGRKGRELSRKAGLIGGPASAKKRKGDAG